MLESLKQIGDAYLEERGDWLDCLTTPVPEKNKDKDNHVIFVDFNTKKKIIELSARQIPEKADQVVYTHLGGMIENNLPPRGSQLLITQSGNDLARLLENMPLVVNEYITKNSLESTDWGGVVAVKFKDISNIFYDNVNQKESKLKFDKILIEGRPAGDAVKSTTELLKAVLDREGITAKNQVSLIVLKIDGDFVLQTLPEYKNLLYHYLISHFFDENGNQEFISRNRQCSVCGGKKEVLASNAFPIKYYITKNVGFSSYLNKNFDSNYICCEKCYTSLLCGKRYIFRELQLQIAGINVAVFPKIIDSKGVTSLERLHSAKSIKKVLEELARFENKTFKKASGKPMFNLLFYERGNNEFKILDVFEDIRVFRAHELLKNLKAINDMGVSVYRSQNKLGLDRVFYLLGGERKSYLQFLSRLFKDERIYKQNIIEVLTTNLKRKKATAEKMSYFDNEIILSMMLIEYLYKLNLFR